MPLDKIKGHAKKVEGEIQEKFGEVTDNVKHQVEGKAKQLEGEARVKAEEVKDDVNEKASDFIAGKKDKDCK